MQFTFRFSVLAFFIASLAFQGFAQTDSTTIVVNVIELRSNDGKVGITLFNSEDGFPGDSDKAIEKRYVEIRNYSAETVFENIPAGKYAIAVYHDEDGDREIETNFIGIPKEGTGSSNNPKSRMGPPRFRDCVFDTRE
nr:DUF2141 domain-containing protein [Bacteroidota bacterium]